MRLIKINEPCPLQIGLEFLKFFVFCGHTNPTLFCGQGKQAFLFAVPFQSTPNSLSVLLFRPQQQQLVSMVVSKLIVYTEALADSDIHIHTFTSARPVVPPPLCPSLSVICLSLPSSLSLCSAGLLAPLVMANPNLVSFYFFTPLIVPLKKLDSFVYAFSFFLLSNDILHFFRIVSLKTKQLVSIHTGYYHIIVSRHGYERLIVANTHSAY